MSSGSVSLEISRTIDYFPIEIVLNESDAQEPAVFAPFIPDLSKYKLPDEQKKLAWHLYSTNNNITEISEDELGYTEKLEYINPTSFVRVITLSEDKNDTTTHKTEALSIVRFGKATFRIYGPEEGVFWKKDRCKIESVATEGGEKTGDSDATETRNLLKDEKMLLLGLHAEAQKKADLRQFDITLEPKKFGGFQKSLAEYERLSKTRGGFVELNLIIPFRERIFSRSWIIPANRSDPHLLEESKKETDFKTKDSGNKQFKKNGRKKEIHKEMLTFSGDTEKTVKYWYAVPEQTWSEENSNPSIRILEWTNFVDAKGEQMKDPNKVGDKENSYPKNLNPNTSKFGHTFYAPCPCWGSLLVEYEVEYTEYSCFYDVPKPVREFEVVSGQISKIGYCTYDKSGELLEYCAYEGVLINFKGFEEDKYELSSSRQILLGMGKTDLDKLTAQKRISFVNKKATDKDEFRVVTVPFVENAGETSQTKAFKKSTDNPIVWILRDPDAGEDGTTLAMKMDFSVQKLTFEEFNTKLKFSDIYACALFKLLRFKPFVHSPYIAIATNGVRTTDLTFNPPMPNFLDFSEREMPKCPVFTKYIREKAFPDPNNFNVWVEVDHVDEIVFVDMLGNISSESLTQYRSQNEQEVQELEEEMQKRTKAYDAQVEKRKEKEKQDESAT